MKLTLLGTGSPGCYPGSYQTAAAVVVNGTPFVIDCGGGAVQRLAAACANGQPALELGKLDKLILTHLHPDHTAGLADFIISTWIKGRRDPLIIFGPKGTRKMVNHLIDAYELGISAHWEEESPTAWPLTYAVVEYTDGELYSDENVTITAFRVSHGVMETYGLKFISAEKTLVWASDTCPTSSVVDNAKGCDLLVHEAYSEVGINYANLPFPRSYHRRMHTSTVELAEIATQIQPKRLVLQHQMHLGPVSDEAFLKEITDLYGGEVIFGRDLDVFEC